MLTPPPWTETFNFESNSGWTLVTGSNGTIDVDPSGEPDKLDYDLVEDLCSSTASKTFSEGALSDTMWTMLANEIIWTSVDTIPSACFYGASNNNLPNKDSNNKDFLGGLMAGCGSTNTGTHGCTKESTNGVVYSDCWTGNGSGSDNWDTLFRTSATGARYYSYPSSDRTATPDYDDTFTVSSSCTGLDRILACGSADGAGGRRSNGTINEIIFKNEVNEE
jgi:hypothetical protein